MGKADIASMVWLFVMHGVCLLQLFANVLKHHVVKLDYQQLARAMGDTLADVTPKAISHRIAKIKEKAQAHRNRWDPYIRLVASPKRVASLKPASIGMLSEEGDDDEGKEFMDLKSEDEQLFAANLGGVDGGEIVVGGQMLSCDESGGGDVGEAVVAEAGRGGSGGGGSVDERKYLLGVDGLGHWPVPASGFEVYGMKEAAKGMVGKDEAGIHLLYEAPSSYPSATVVDDNGLRQNRSERGSCGGGGFRDEGAVFENSA
ncbi:hypothetical protein C7212DRAFT_366580 [Tuber magnatum]|uniref:Uncharacterized protein n=1 Tax=Tuber magnatum TaxID=42249 RepID=A0A317SDS6_9PEZI|nr:hypothetical protein C7212DRAFT_366580 [Tuber magnatum]